MLINTLLLIPLAGVLIVSTSMNHHEVTRFNYNRSKIILYPIIVWFGFMNNNNLAKHTNYDITPTNESNIVNKRLKFIALNTSILALFVSLIVYALFDFSNNEFQFVQERYEISYFSFYLGIDGLSIYFVLLTTIIMPISLLSN